MGVYMFRPDKEISTMMMKYIILVFIALILITSAQEDDQKEGRVAVKGYLYPVSVVGTVSMMITAVAGAAEIMMTIFLNIFEDYDYGFPNILLNVFQLTSGFFLYNLPYNVLI